MFRQFAVLCVPVAAFMLTRGPVESAFAEDWGTIKGRFVYVGKAPVPEKIKVEKDVEICGKHPLVNESLVVSKDGGVKNVVVFLRTEKGAKLAVHPDYAKTAKDEVVLDN